MPKTLTAIVLAIVTLGCALVDVFLLQMFAKGGFADPMMIAGVVLFTTSAAFMWLAFRSGRNLVALVMAAAPVIIVAVLVSMIRIRLF